MKSFVKLAAIAMVVATQPIFALPVIHVPDGGATALLTVISVSGLIIGKNFLKKH